MSKKDIEKNIDKIMSVVNKPKYVCAKCARAANEKEIVCKPVKIKIKKSG
jgi:hypothetical protein